MDVRSIPPSSQVAVMPARTYSRPAVEAWGDRMWRCSRCGQERHSSEFEGQPWVDPCDPCRRRIRCNLESKKAAIRRRRQRNSMEVTHV